MGDRESSRAGAIVEPPIEGGAPVSSAVPSSTNRRSSERIEVTWSVDCETEDTFLYANITNISELGIFVRTESPLPRGTVLTLRFAPPRAVDGFVLEGKVQWVNPMRPGDDNPNPGMGIRLELGPEDREKLVDVIRTITYLRDDPSEG